MSDWTGYSIAAVILVIVAIIAIIAGIVMLENQTTPPASGTISWPWFLIIGGVILLIIGIIVGYMGRRTTGTVFDHTSIVHHGHSPHAAYYAGAYSGFPGSPPGGTQPIWYDPSAYSATHTM